MKRTALTMHSQPLYDLDRLWKTLEACLCDTVDSVEITLGTRLGLGSDTTVLRVAPAHLLARSVDTDISHR